MTFPNQPTLTPTTIGRIDHFLDDLDGTQGNQSLHFNLSVHDQNGDEMKRMSGDEAPHLTAQQITQLRTFMNDRRTNLAADIGFAPGNVPGRCTWRFRDGDGSTPSRSLYARVVELDSGGLFVKTHIINDQPNMTGAQVTAAIAFLDAQRTKAVAEVL